MTTPDQVSFCNVFKDFWVFKENSLLFRSNGGSWAESRPTASLLVRLAGQIIAQKGSPISWFQDPLRSIHRRAIFRHHILLRNGYLRRQKDVWMLEWIPTKVSFSLRCKLENSKAYIVYYSSKEGSLLQFDWGIWPPTQYINFVYIPPAFRVLYVNFVTVIWDIFLSWVKHKVCLHFQVSPYVPHLVSRLYSLD